MLNKENSEIVYIKKFHKLLEKSLEKAVEDKEEVAIAFSGGVDSSVIAKIMKDMNFKFKCYVVGIKGSKDLEAAGKTAKQLNLKLKKIVITEKDIKTAIPIQLKILNKLYRRNKQKKRNPKLKPNPVSISFNLPLFFVAKHAKEKKIIVCHGPDDLLLGYVKYKCGKGGRNGGRKNIKKEIKKSIKLFFKTDFLQNNATAEYFRKKFIMPYLEKEIIKFCLSLPHKFKIKNKTRKYLLRKLALKIGLNKETAFRERKAAQYGSGIMKTMKKLAKDKGLKINTYIKTL